MLLNKVDAAYAKYDFQRISQGDIFRDILLVIWAEKRGEKIEIVENYLPYAIVLTQDCDLEQDYNNRVNSDSKNNDKYLQSILLCPAYQAQSLREGSHLEKMDLRMESFNSKMWDRLKKNNMYRYHFLQECPDLQVPDIVVDFKHYFTIPREVLYSDEYNKNYIATVGQLFRENLSNRFAQYLSRIGLPEIKSS